LLISQTAYFIERDTALVLPSLEIYTPILKACICHQKPKEHPMDDQPINNRASDLNLATNSVIEGPIPSRRARNSFKISFGKYWAILALITYIAGLGSGYFLRGSAMVGDDSSSGKAASSEHDEMSALFDQVNPPDGYELPFQYGDFAPRLVAAGVIDYAGFVKLYQEIGSPLTDQQIAILTKGNDTPVVINNENQHFLLNLFWALGLANQNKILTEGPMIRNGKDKVVNFASTGGWTLATAPVADLYASQPIVSLTNEQQKRLEGVTAGVYRPCCDNPTHFPDCNHGMAMLGLLELMASQGASVAEMFESAKYVNAFWFPKQALELAVLFKTAKNVDFAQVDGSQVVGQQLFSGSGFRSVHQWLVQNGNLDQVPDGGGSCGVK
jgi:hypothetical protein